MQATSSDAPVPATPFGVRLVLASFLAAIAILGILTYGAHLRGNEGHYTATAAELTELASRLPRQAYSVADEARALRTAPDQPVALEAARATLKSAGEALRARIKANDIHAGSVMHEQTDAVLAALANVERAIEAAVAAPGAEQDRAVSASIVVLSTRVDAFNAGIVDKLVPFNVLNAHSAQNVLALATVAVFLAFIAIVVFPASSRLRDASRRLEIQASQFARLALIAERTSNAVIIADREGRIEWVNEGFTRITGYALGEVVGRLPSSFLNCDMANPETIRELAEAVRLGRGIRRQILNRNKAGGTYWADVEIQPLTDRTGGVTGFMALESDITEARNAAEALQQRNKDLAMVAQVAGVGPWRVDLVDRTAWWSDIVRKIHDVDADYEPTLEAAIQFYPPGARETLIDVIEETIATRKDFNVVLPFDTAKGKRITVRVMGSVQYEGDKPVSLVGAFQDVTAEVEAEATIRLMSERLEMATTSANIGLWDYDLDQQTTWFDESFWRSLGYSPDSRPRRVPEFDALIHPDDLEQTDTNWDAALLKSNATYSAEFRLLDGLGQWRWVESVGRATKRDAHGRATRISGVMIDIDHRRRAEEQRSHDQQQLWSLANLDALTGLPNRSLFGEKLEEMVQKSAREGQKLAFGILDLDRFKEVNDSFGHLIGDEYLVAMVQRMQQATRSTDVLGRLGGDEFAFVLGDVESLSDAERRVAAVLAGLCDPITLSNSAKRSGGSIGFAVYPEDGQTPTDLMRRADLALYEAKEAGRRIARRFTAAMEVKLSLGHGLRHEFDNALDQDEIIVFYQPLLTVDRSQVTGFEALARWNHPEKGIVAPAAFASALSEPHLAQKLGKCVRSKVFAQIRAWREAGVPVGRIAINVTTSDFTQGSVAEELLASARIGLILPSDVSVEITEGVLLDGNANDRIRKDLADLKDAGFEIAFDDFGTGYASLSHLREYPINRIKVDRSFVVNLPDSVRDLEIVRTIGILAQSLKLQVTAEGIETEAQAEVVRRLGATHLQGYFFARPMHPDRVAGYLTRFNADVARQGRRFVA